MLLMLMPAIAHGQPHSLDKSASEALLKQCREALEKEDYPPALEACTKAEKIYPETTKPVLLLVYLARACKGSGKIIRAIDAYSRAANRQVPSDAHQRVRDAHAEAVKELESIRDQVAKLSVVVKPHVSNVTVRLDEAEAFADVLFDADPGKHVITVKAEGYKDAQTNVDLQPGKSKVVDVLLEKEDPCKLKPDLPACVAARCKANPDLPMCQADPCKENPQDPKCKPPPPPSPPPPTTTSSQRTLGWLGVGLGGASLIAGGIFGGIALGNKSTAESLCTLGPDPNDPTKKLCTFSQDDAKSGKVAQYNSANTTYKTMGTISGITLGVGGALVITGVIFIATAPSGSETSSKPPAKVRWAPVVTAHSLGISGTF